MEMSYIDLLAKLQSNVESDIIPNKEKKHILELIYQLQCKLVKYSY